MLSGDSSVSLEASRRWDDSVLKGSDDAPYVIKRHEGMI
jgi:hypothetical protein